MAFRMSDVASIGQGALDAYMKSNQINDIQGAAALGRAFQQQPQQGPIDQLNAQGPQAPPPGQASTPSMAGGPQGMSSLPIYNQPAGPQLPAQGPPQAPPPSGGGGMFGGMAGWDPGERPVGSPAPIGAGPVQPPIPQGPPDPQMLAREGGNMPPAAGGAFPGPQQGPGGMPQFDLRTLSARINAANPNLPPAVMIAALERAAPLLNAQSKTELAQLKQYMDQQNLQLRRDTLDVREGIANQRSQDTRYGVDTRAGTAATAEQGRGERATQAEEGRTSRTTQREEGASERAAAGRSSREGIAERAETGRNERFKANYDRLTTNAENRFKDSAARLDEMVKRRLSGEDRSRAVRELRTLEDQARADHNAIMEQIQAGFLGNAQDKKRLMAEAVAKRDENMKRIEAYRSQIKAGGQTEAPAGALPPEARSLLKEGTITTFQNGQKWTLENGQPKQVQ